MKWKPIIALVSASLLGILAGLAVWWRPLGPARPDLPAVVLQVRSLKQLVTVRYSLQRIVGLTEEKVPIGSESILLLVQGEAQAGVDVGKISDEDVVLPTARDRIVTMSLPPAELTAVFLDEKQTRVWDRHVTWWTPWVPYSLDLESKARSKGVDDIRAAALKMGILEQAQTNAESAIRGLLGALQIQVRFAQTKS
jgi:hypothetical protein